MAARGKKAQVEAMGPITDEMEETIDRIVSESPFNEAELYEAVEALYQMGADTEDVPVALGYITDFAESHYVSPEDTAYAVMPIIHLSDTNIHGLDPIFSHVHKYIVRNPTTPLEALSTYEQVLKLGHCL